MFTILPPGRSDRESGGFTSFPVKEDAVHAVEQLAVDFTTTEPDLRLPVQLVPRKEMTDRACRLPSA